MYSTLDILPVKTYFKIIETGNLYLLNPDKSVKDEELLEVWESIHNEFQEKGNNHLNRRIFRISVDIEFLTAKYNLIQMCIDTLRFDRNEDAIKFLREHNYIITDKFYNRDLDRAERNSKGIFNKIDLLKNQLPKPENNKSENSPSIDDVLASYSNILGFHIGDFNRISCSEYLAFKKQVDNKVKQQEAEIRKLKSKKNGR